MIKAIGFDVGHTLIKYNNPLNWSLLYEAALLKVMKDCNIIYEEDRIISAIEVLKKYNTRINYREYEVTADMIFEDIVHLWHVDRSSMIKIKNSFFDFYRNDAVPYQEVEDTLKKLKEMNIRLGILTDAAYGMDNEYSLKDVESISHYLDVQLTSVDVGFRKPNEKGFIMLAKQLRVKCEDMLFVGDEKKDITGANNLRICSVLINRDDEKLDFGQRYTIKSMDSLIDIVNIENDINKDKI